jgi:hypothetical protein
MAFHSDIDREKKANKERSLAEQESLRGITLEDGGSGREDGYATPFRRVNLGGEGSGRP